jgi:multidrug efflux pump subunit AcrA (membrane-fusion protein)
MVQRIQQENNKARIERRSSRDSSHGQIVSQLDEIISTKPARLLRWGSAIICSVVAVLALSMCFISYPDYLEGTAQITTNPLPLPIRTKQSGKLNQLFTSDGSLLKQEQIIAELENSTGFENIIQLEQLSEDVLSALANENERQLLAISVKLIPNLGEAQTNFNALKLAVEAYLRRNANNIHEQRQSLLQTQLGNIHSLQNSKIQSVTILDQQVKDAREQFDAYQKLYDQKVISKQELTTEAKRYRDILIASEAQKQSDLQNRISATEQQKQLLELKHSELDKKQSQTSEIVAQVRNLQSFIRDWKLKYLITAPTKGHIYFREQIQPNAPLEAEQQLAVIVPEKAQLIAEISVPTSGAGKIQRDNPIQISLDQYPRSEFGYVKGKIQTVSTLPTTDGKETRYRVVARLPEKLVTSYSTPIQFSGIMHGRARIVLNERSVLERMVAVLKEVRN